MSNSLAEFDAFYNQKLKPVLFKDHESEPECLKQVLRRFDSMIDYNVPHGKKLRGLCAYESFLILNKQSNAHALTDQAKAVGWCIEFLQGSFLVADDIMDNSTMRRGQPCWYLQKNVGNIAINDAFYLFALVYKIINLFLHNHILYPKFYELFTEVNISTIIGQGLDLITPIKSENEDEYSFQNYTQEQYDAIVKWKTAFYSFILPVQAALYLVNIDNAEIHAKCREILHEMGHFFQIQDDYLDCYGDPKLTGKVGTDIEEGKCSWLVVQALKKASPEQLTILKKNYGKQDQESVRKIKELYNELNLPKDYEEFETKTFNDIMSKISNLTFVKSCPCYIEGIKNMITAYAKKIFKRNK